MNFFYKVCKHNETNDSLCQLSHCFFKSNYKNVSFFKLPKKFLKASQCRAFFAPLCKNDTILVIFQHCVVEFTRNEI